MSDAPLQVQTDNETEIAPGVFVFPDGRINLVPNVGVVLGDDAALVVDTGMGPANGDAVLAAAQRLAGSRRLLLTVTHFHPEHGYGAARFSEAAQIVYNTRQATELAESGPEFIEMFKTFGAEVEAALEGVELVQPHETFAGEMELDLGGRIVTLREEGGAHTAGDEVVLVPDAKVMFAGDLVENRFFPIVFGDVADGPAWIDVLERLGRIGAEIVVPGHGEVGGPELIGAFRDYLIDVRDAVAGRVARGEDVEQVAAELAPEVRERYADWENPEWIDFAIRNFHGKLSG